MKRDRRGPVQDLPLLPSLLLLLIDIPYLSAAAATTTTIKSGFSVKYSLGEPHLLYSTVSFQEILGDPGGNFSFGFLMPMNSDSLHLAVVHIPSGFPIWRASRDGRAVVARRSNSISLSFDGGTLLLSGPQGAVLWKVGSPAGDVVELHPTSNLQVRAENGSVLWQSFDAPFDTLVVGQNFTSSAALSSPNSRFSSRLGANFIALYMNSGDGRAYAGRTAVMYWQEKAFEETGTIDEKVGPIYARLNQTGFLGLYQDETNRVHILPFDTNNRNLSRLRRLTLETDGNLRAYYWNSSAWASDYSAIRESCELPTYCGAYGLCTRDKDECQCLGGSSAADACLPRATATSAVLAYDKLLLYKKVGSQEECERGCERNCSCWGALYNNLTRTCYRMGFPAETLVATSENRVGYFKVRLVTSHGGGGSTRKRVLLACLLVLLGVVLCVVFTLWYRRRRLRRGLSSAALMGDTHSPVGTYKEFKGSTSFRDVELSSSSSSSKR
ncbi:unnamed protein product [Spirodela intermedia]|uniref:Bulb-type lectin domain-containing protein n=1 Tax=Spirodela intermedia TaxID=51605 RepID=A0A7I8IRW2_SPIIN|nr:unnamed protein product [Spirodela intermedia]CAA6660731.1 unnamed protein product [Spirodela intermedia]